MSYTRKQIVTSVSILYLALLTALSGYISSRTTRLSTPISSILTGFTTALPLLSGLLLEGSHSLTLRQQRRQHITTVPSPRPPLTILANTVILIYSTVLMTLLGTHAAPSAELNCGLQATWKKLFMQKNNEAIKTIQETFACCGLMNPLDMPWPFPSKENKGGVQCRETFHRTRGCIGAWRAEEQNMAGVLMGLVGAVVVWQLVIIVAPTKGDSWLHRVLPDRLLRASSDEERQVVPYSAGGRYSDNATTRISEEDVEDVEDVARRTAERSVNEARNEIRNEQRNERRSEVRREVRNFLTSAEEDGAREEHGAFRNEWTTRN